jgi:DNA-binding IclR family transcriptional regulator
VEVLRAFTPETPTLSVAELVRRTGLAKTTVLRMTGTLEEAGLLLRDETGDYRPGLGLLHWAWLAQADALLPPSVHLALRNAATATGESVTLYVRRGITRIPVARADGTSSIRHVVSVGEPMTLAAGASSWVLLTEASEAIIEAVAAEPLARGVDVAVRAGQAARDGFAVSHGEREDGVSGVAAPVRHGGKLVAAVACSGPTSRFDEETVEELVRRMQALGQEVEFLLNGMGVDPSSGASRGA